MDEEQSTCADRKTEGVIERIGPQRVASIRRSGIIRQSEIQKLADLQAAAWQAEKATQRAMLRLEKRIEAGEEVEDGPMYFDRELGMVRTKKENAG